MKLINHCSHSHLGTVPQPYLCSQKSHIRHTVQRHFLCPRHGSFNQIPVHHRNKVSQHHCHKGGNHDCIFCSGDIRQYFFQSFHFLLLTGQLPLLHLLPQSIPYHSLSRFSAVPLCKLLSFLPHRYRKK